LLRYQLARVTIMQLFVAQLRGWLIPGSPRNCCVSVQAMAPRLPLRSWSCACALLCVVVPAPAAALQPLEVFLEGARRANHDNLEAIAVSAQRSAEVDVATARLYPTFTAAGTYTRHQHEVALALPVEAGGDGERLVIQPNDQFDATLSLTLPLIDVGAWRRISAASASSAAAQATQRATEQDVEASVFRSYYQLLGQQAVLDAAKRSFEVLQKNQDLVQTKLESGTASRLDVERARAELARAQGEVASAELALVTVRRQLATATAIEPEPATGEFDDDLHEEPPLSHWLRHSGKTPRVLAAHAAQHAAQAAVDAAEAAWLPTLSATAQERFTNATSFSGHPAVYLVQATLAWRLDASLPAAVRAQHAAAAAQAVRTERAQRVVQDAIFQAWHAVATSIQKSRAARMQVGASRLAAELARDRYSVGAATQLEVIQAQQEAFGAEVARVQADTDLAYARASLRASAGRFARRGTP
jgi:outer membrane protein TolC